jgi:hypothetical protein
MCMQEEKKIIYKVMLGGQWLDLYSDPLWIVKWI